jgi:hypothetical protein
MERVRRLRLLIVAAIAAASAIAAIAMAASSCAPAGFQSGSVVSSVRILASRADQPYARPGSTVTLQVLAYDGRPSKPEPMTIYWIPFACMNPLNDAYYNCFAQLGAAAARAPVDGGASVPALDLTALPTGPTFQVTVPADAITSHPAIAGMQIPYGLAIVFNIACAGHLEIVPLDPGNVQSPPIGCFDAQHNQLGPDDYVFGFTRVYAYDDLTNANPIQTLDSSIAPDAIGTIDMPRCAPGSCTPLRIGPVVPASSQEVDPTQHDANQNVVKEQIWAEFFSTIGSLDDDVRLLYDSETGSLGAPSDTDNHFTPPGVAGDGMLWIVVHDNRGGASWQAVPLHVQ